jgi:ABC-2 type transport system permease protein
VDGRLFGDFLNQQVGFTLFLTIFGGAGLVANDLRTGAIVMYLARPLTRRDYVVGKLGVTFLLNLAVTLAPGLLLYAIALALAPEQFAKWELWWIAPAIAAQALVMSLSVSLLGLAVSALTKSARVSGLGFFAFIMGLELVRRVLDHGFDLPQATLLSLQDNLRNLARALFGLTDRSSSVPWPASAAVIVLLALGCLLILRRRVRAVEVIG